MNLLNALLFSCAVCFAFLLHNAYPVYQPEALIFTAGFFFTIAVIYGLAKLVRQAWLFYYFIVLFFIDLSSGILFTSPERLALVFLPLPAFFLLRKKLPRIFLTILTGMLIATPVFYFFKPSKLEKTRISESSEPARGLPNVVILLLDEHAGLEQFEVMGAPDLKNQWIRDYTAKGFTVYGNAYSQYSWTFESLLSLHQFEQTHGFVYQKTLKPLASRIFQNFANQGYDINVYSNEWVDYCSPNQVAKCFTMPDNALGFLSPWPVPVLGKAWIVLNFFVESHQSRFLKNLLRRLPSSAWDIQEKVSPFSAPRILEELEKDILSKPSGNVFYAHILLPHYPFIFDGGCNLRDFFKHAPKYPETSAAYKAYSGQAACVQSRLKTLFDLMEEMNVFKNTAVIVFGDHGARLIPRPRGPVRKNENWNLYLKDRFSAFLAVKPAAAGENPPGKYVAAPVSLGETLADYFKLDPGAEREALRKIYVTPETDDGKYAAAEFPP